MAKGRKGQGKGTGKGRPIKKKILAQKKREAELNARIGAM